MRNQILFFRKESWNSEVNSSTFPFTIVSLKKKFSSPLKTNLLSLSYSAYPKRIVHTERKKESQCVIMNASHHYKWSTPGWAPSSITCNFDIVWPALTVFDAKQIRTEGFSFPATYLRKTKPIISKTYFTNAWTGNWITYDK